MPHRVLAAALLGSLLCAAPRQAFAGDPPLPVPALPRPAAEADQAPAWPTKLKLRNARYASLTRVDDPSGDVHERLIAHMQMNRVDDHVGDLEEVRRRRTSGHVPPLAVKDAHVMREQDLLGDGNQLILATMRHERRHAETRRFRDLAGDTHELADYKRDQKQIRLDREDRITHGNVLQPASRLDFIDKRDRMELETGESVNEAEREEQMQEDRDERLLAREDQDREREAERAAESAAKEAEDKEDREADDVLDQLTEGSDARLEESVLERRTEAQLEQEEAGAGGKP